jgi:glycosyltransferase involved in cell wall biosynthesis
MEVDSSSPLVSVCLPVRNGAERLPRVIRSVIAQDYGELELVISDNASTDATEDVCREFAAEDDRIAYHRHPENIGLLGNFIAAMRISRGEFFRWVGDDDWLASNAISGSLAPLIEDDRRILATTRVAYTDEEEVTRVDDAYDGIRLASADPIVRFSEILRLLNESRMLIDPLYALFRRGPVAQIPRRNMLKEDEVFATKLALAGPWAHVPEVLVERRTRTDSLPDIARRLDVPVWHAQVATALECREILRWLRHVPLTPEQHRQARAAVGHMFIRRQRRTTAHRSRKLVRLATGSGRGE